MVEPAAALKGSKWFSWRAQSNDANFSPLSEDPEELMFKCERQIKWATINRKHNSDLSITILRFCSERESPPMLRSLFHPLQSHFHLLHHKCPNEVSADLQFLSF